MGLLGIGIREARDRAQTRAAKKKLEAKLGRKVTERALYSLSANLEATEVSTPDPQAPPSRHISRRKMLIVFSSVLLIVLLGVPFVWVMSMSESEWNHLNPFTPKPPAGSFPQQLGTFRRSGEPEYHKRYSASSGPHFTATYYGPRTPWVEYTIWDFPNPASARDEFLAKRKSPEGRNRRMFQMGEDRYAFATLGEGNTTIYLLENNHIHCSHGLDRKAVIAFDAELCHQTPFTIGELSETGNLPVIPVLTLLNDYAKDSKAADLKYKLKTVVITGEVTVAEKNKKGKPVIAFMRPSAKSANDGMAICDFAEANEADALAIKKGETVRISARVFGNLLGNVMLQNCQKQ
ncbi:MAG: hypothetical protein DMF69_05865 [Acidobacteria bacterium]|nr:MAG: hypothetical protein DMF69_05865 [Acidobacteriota bacterium]